jgi:hypothetical protein
MMATEAGVPGGAGRADEDEPGPQPHPSDEPPIPDREDLPGEPRAAPPA